MKRTEAQKRHYQRHRDRLLKEAHDWYVENRAEILAKRKLRYLAKKGLKEQKRPSQ